MIAFTVRLRTLAPNGRPNASEWVRILQETALLHPGRDPADGFFIHVAADGERLTATAYQICEDA